MDASTEGGAVAILDVGGVDLSGNQQTAGVGEDVTFAALDLLARVKAPWTAAFRGLDRLAVDDAGRWAGLAPLGLAGRHQEMVIDARPQRVVPPRGEIDAAPSSAAEKSFGSNRQGQPERKTYRMAFTTSRRSVVLGRPRACGAGIWGSITRHSASVRSLA